MEQDLTTQAETIEVDIETLRKAALSERLVAHEYIESLRNELQELTALKVAYERCVGEFEDLLGAIQSEHAQLVALTHAVESSHFWKIRRWMRRLCGRHDRA